MFRPFHALSVTASRSYFKRNWRRIHGPTLQAMCRDPRLLECGGSCEGGHQIFRPQIFNKSSFQIFLRPQIFLRFDGHLKCRSFSFAIADSPSLRRRVKRGDGIERSVDVLSRSRLLLLRVKRRGPTQAKSRRNFVAGRDLYCLPVTQKMPRG